nr:E6 [Columba livia papillomavirus 1]
MPTAKSPALLRLPTSLPKILQVTGRDLLSVNIHCPYCRCILTVTEILQLYEEDIEQSTRGLFHALWYCNLPGFRVSFLGACAKCRLFLNNA